MKIKQFVWGISFFMLFSCNTRQEKSYPDADAVYLNLTRTYVLDQDGSIIHSVEKKQRLITYRSFQSLYGETRITYNPEFQKLVVNEAYTTNSGNQIIKTPENGYNEVLPAFCQDSKAYSHLREMVVTHTGLERNAVINCSYKITSAGSKIPFLMGMEELQADCPIENLAIVVKVPSKMKLHYKLLNLTSEPTIDQGKDFDTYTWNFQDLPQRSKENRSALVCGDIPTLLFTTQEDISAVIKAVLKPLALGINNVAIKEYVESATKDKKSIQEKAMKIQEIVVSELKTLHIPSPLVAFEARPPEAVWQSNSGTVLEKAFLLNSLFRSKCWKSEVCLNIPTDLAGEQLPFLLAAEPIVKLTDPNGEMILLTADRLNSGNSDLGIFPVRILNLDQAVQLTPVIPPPTGLIKIEGNLTISPDNKLVGEITGQFSDRFNPYFEIVRNQGKCPPFLTDFIGSVGKLTANQANISFKADKKDQLVKRGGFRFLDLKESTSGISSFHLVSMSITRNSALYLGTSVNESYHYTFKLPAKCELINPVNIEIVKPGIGHVVIRLKQTENLVEVIRKIEIVNPVIARKDYMDFKELIDKWYTHKFKQLIFRSIN